MKKKLALSVLLVVIFAELVGLFGLIYHRYCFMVQKDTYNRLINQCFEENNDIRQIRELLYLHEFVTSSLLFPNPMVKQADQKEKAAQVELQIRKQIIRHGELFQKLPENSEKAKLFRLVNDDVLNYLNFNTVILTVINTVPQEEITAYVQKNIEPLIERVNASTDSLSELSDIELTEIRNKIDVDLKRSGYISFLCIFLMIVAIIFSLYYTSTTTRTLELDKEVLTFKTELKDQKINSIQQQVIIAMADLVESRSGETGQHVKRTSHLVSLILQNAVRHKLWPEILTETFINNVTRSAPLHDIGKITVPDAVLMKPGKYTPEEFEIMKTHTVSGGEIIHKILDNIEDAEYVKTAVDIATCHHEKWDGSGYPKGLAGKDIPLSARIMAVADVFDALVSERCYKKPICYEDAFAIIQSESGKHFDPEIVMLFMELQNEIENKK